jgi:hypothetical protein
MSEINIKITWKEWMAIQKFIGKSKLSLGQIRKRFNTEFVDFINAKMNYLNNSCTIGQGFNWFRKEESQRNRTSPYWSGKYKCQERTCDCSIALKIQNIVVDLEVVVNIKFSKDSKHIKFPVKTRCQGEARDNQKMLLLANGTLNTLNSNIISNAECPEKGYTFLFNFKFSNFEFFGILFAD